LRVAVGAPHVFGPVGGSRDRGLREAVTRRIMGDIADLLA
jgi:hypothetical protein